MRNPRDLLAQPKTVGVLCAIGATLLGLAYMAAAGAPLRYLLINAGALALGLATLPLVAQLPLLRSSGVAVLAGGGALLATALFGNSIEGAARWVAVGPLTVQVSLIVLPAMILAFARHPDAVGAVGMGLTAIALALQPDRAMAGVLAAGLAAVTMRKPDRATLLALLSAGAAFAVTLVRADALPAVPFVDRILYSAFGVHPLAGVAVVGGACLLALPAPFGWLHDREHARVHLAFGTLWAGIVAAAAIGNYPTPVVGYGGSAILGYLLSVAVLPRSTRPATIDLTRFKPDRTRRPNDPHLRTRIA